MTAKPIKLRAQRTPLIENGRPQCARHYAEGSSRLIPFQRSIPGWILVVAIGLLWTAIDLPREVAVGQLVPRSTHTYLLLRNGSLMKGRIYVVAQGFDVESPSGSRTRISRAQVVAHYNSIQQVFGHKFLQAKKKNRVEKYSQLVFWCVDKKLFAEAEQVVGHFAPTFQSRQSTIGNRRDPNSAAATRLTRYIAAARERLARPRSSSTANTGSAGDSNIRQVAWNSTTDDNANQMLQPRRAKKYLPSIAQMEAATDKMPKNANAVFRKLQVRMTTGCNAAKCHAQPTNSFQIIPFRRGQTAGWRDTQKNIYFALQFSDKTDPAKSKLLQMMRTQHGGQTQAAFPKDSEAYIMARNWLYVVTGNAELLLRRLHGQAQAIQRGTPPKVQGTPPPSNGPMKTDDPTPVTPPDPAKLERQPEQLAKDPFDPDLFNRKHHPQRKPRH